MSQCGKKVKNPCKLCLQSVTQKTGLQCEGACLSWVHYSCLNYTPGRINDIRKGIIKVTCPCPDCKTKFPKEYRTDETFSCNNEQCPANRPPKCEHSECPSNKGPFLNSPYTMPPLLECGVDCKKHGNTNNNIKSSDSQPKNSSSSCASGCASSGDVPENKPTDTGFSSMQAVEQMCETVQKLTTQINNLMSKMVEIQMEQHQKQGGGGGCSPKNKKNCSQKGPKSQCPKPCNCLGNPAGRN